MSEKTNTVEGGNTPQGEKTFTQEEVNRIVQKRLAEEKSKQEAELVEREKALSQREMTVKAQELLEKNGLPKALAGVLRYSTEEELTEAVDTLRVTKGFIKEEAEQPKKRIIENRLEFGNNDSGDDPLREAFGLTKERYDG